MRYVYLFYFIHCQRSYSKVYKPREDIFSKKYSKDRQIIMNVESDKQPFTTKCAPFHEMKWVRSSVTNLLRVAFRNV